MRISQKLSLLFAPALVLVVLAFSASPAFANEAWWRLTSGANPTYMSPAKEENGKIIPGKGEIVLAVANLGDAAANGEITIVDTLPKGLTATSIEIHEHPGACVLEHLTCVIGGPLPYGHVRVKIGVEVQQGAESGEVNEASVSGGGVPGAHVARAITVSSAPVPFGLEENELTLEEEGGAPDTRAGSHPFQATDTVVMNNILTPNYNNGGQHTQPVALPKDISVKTPPGLIGNPDPIPRCSLKQFLTLFGEVNECPEQTAVGVASVYIAEPNLAGYKEFVVPLFNLEPTFGEPARFGFWIREGEVPTYLDASVRGGPGTGEEYAITVTSPNITQVIGLLSVQITFWGVPDSPVHESSRGWDCLSEERGFHNEGPCHALETQHPQSFLTMPTSCTGPLQSSTETDSWLDPGNLLSFAPSQAMQALDGCNQLAFKPAMQAEPTTGSAASPSGLDFNLSFDDEGLTSAKVDAQSQLSKTVVTLPEGLTIDPSAGVGLAGCTPADYARETIESAPGAGCPNESKLGTVEIETPLLTQKIQGNIFIAKPYENPFSEPGHPNGSLVALYVVAKNPETGVMIKLAGKVEAGGQPGVEGLAPGQLRTTFENNPQLPFDHFNFHFREGVQAPLITPATCGTYTTTAALTPWSEPTMALTDSSSFTVTSGVGGGACPSGGVPPFHPGIESGMLNNNAGSFSAFYLHLTRGDADQEISGFSTDLPPGLTGSLTGIPFCPEADIALARTKTGAQEEASPSCPAASEVGHTLVGTGVGAVLAYVPGKIYLAGPYNGAPFSLVSVTSAVVGPFDLGTVVLRFGLSIDPYTAQVSVSPTSSEPIPTILDGIVTHVRDIRVYISRPNFTLNPTSCTPMSIDSTLTGNQGATATITSPFQAASCANLKFAPKFAVSTSGKTSRAKGASLHVDLTYPTAAAGTYANIAKVKVELPKQLPSRLTTLQKACTAAQFEANPAGCPTPSVIGTAKAVVPNIPEPLTGPVYFVSHGGEAFPSLEVVLQGYGVKVILVGATFISRSGITSTTFKTIPDNPVTSFELTLPEGKYSALAANGNLCTQKLVMPADFTAQNGAVIDYKTAVGVTGCAKVKTLTRAQKLKAALKACKRDKNKAKRESCERTAHKRYGPVKKTKKK
jgi:hypothetical protein